MAENGHKTEVVEYIFEFDNAQKESFRFVFDAQSYQLQVPAKQNLPDWTRLEFHQCSNCPLRKADYPHCPAAVALVDVLRRFDTIVSHDRVRLRVRAAERIVAQKTTAQSAIGSLMGLIMATSGCPHPAVFRPMARFHLPVPSEEEVIYRVASMYMLAQYFRYQTGKAMDHELGGLTKIYRAMQKVNMALAARFRAATETDSSVNALVLLDTYAQTMPLMIEDSLDDIRHVFSSWLSASSEYE
ncbi:MAG: hypothetical protein IPJ88_15970 [Myxococcales bacterium]|nr:MAG: hypothetical protein IPJ88_15970 [Myxococcales bacterium]